MALALSFKLALKAGEIAVIPTDTVYGLVCRASDKNAVKRLYKLKSRSGKPGTIIAADTQQLVELGIKQRYIKPIEYVWPDAISVVIPSELKLRYLDQGIGTLAVRVVANKNLIELLEHNGPLMTSSANLPGRPEATTITEAKKYFAGKVDHYIDGGDLSGRPPSTLIRIVDDAIEILRQGAVKINEKGEIISREV